MIVVTERFFVAQEHWTAFEERCRRLTQAMADRRGCVHHCLVRGRDGSASHILHSIWESLEGFQEWTRSDTFVLAANGVFSVSSLPRGQAEVQVLPPYVTPGNRPNGAPWAGAGAG